MAYSESLARRVRDALSSTAGVVEKRMFGGIGFLVAGNMACGVHGERLIARIGPAAARAAVASGKALAFDVGGKTWAAAVMVDGPALRGDAALRKWIAGGVAFARSLPPK